MQLIKYVDIDPLFLTVARISTYDDVETGRVWGNGTGFFYSNPKGDLFLITNRHVIKDEQNSYIPNIVRLSLHANPDNLRENHDYDISLYDGVKPRWIQPNPFADVAAIPLDVNDIKRRMDAVPSDLISNHLNQLTFSSITLAAIPDISTGKTLARITMGTHFKPTFMNYVNDLGKQRQEFYIRGLNRKPVIVPRRNITIYI